MLKKIRYFLSENRLILRLGYIYLAIFIAAVLIGSLLPYDQIPYLKKDEEMFFLSIFLNNLQVGMAILGIGAFTGGIMVAGILFYNGYIIGKLVQYLIVNQEVRDIHRITASCFRRDSWFHPVFNCQLFSFYLSLSIYKRRNN
nr:stage II sporulation protein M [Bacillus pumilus]